MAMADTMVASGSLEPGVELLALTSCHPASDQHAKVTASKELEKLRDKFSPTEFDTLVKRGQAQTLQAVKRSLLDGD